MPPHGVPDGPDLPLLIIDDVDRQLRHIRPRATPGCQRDDEVGEGALDLSGEAAIAGDDLMLIDTDLARYGHDAKGRPLSHNNLREERAPVWQLGRIQMLQGHRMILRTDAAKPHILVSMLTLPAGFAATYLRYANYLPGFAAKPVSREAAEPGRSAGRPRSAANRPGMTRMRGGEVCS